MKEAASHRVRRTRTATAIRPPWSASELAELVTVLDWWRFAVSALGRAGAAFGQGTLNAADDAAFLVLGALDLPLGDVAPFSQARVTRSERRRLAAALHARVVERRPTAYVLGFTELQGVRFKVTPEVLIPRSPLAELLCAESPPGLSTAPARILDLCTGSGCLAVLAALAFPEATVWATDISSAALAVARENVALHRLDERIALIEADGFAGLEGERFDLIVCNPPYVTSESMHALPPEFRWEPRQALAGGRDGMDFLRAVLPSLGNHLTEQGIAFFDVGHNRRFVEQAFPDWPFVWIETEGAADAVFMIERRQL
ncbi:MAG: 50S ribosomal protein L3 N(5)-glutamine methyltransferase [Casimicrobiaceae bacterium]|nr:50S ribosomal protein L3 N(5)-glutamine methyltransferase [Casimicrobiaceae bacterium]MCX8098362.1 50S ribosomal protein L3 N(5)-glutamine methyltransferase [Casimicrobiaceae bacterium]MDW8312522.1 50S ribosomal protein L3 N(5)-glutamine methyltransferase [Burkholderiales bacterium]